MKPPDRTNARARILARLRQTVGHWVPGWELAHVGGWRFGGRIHELRREGYAIEGRLMAGDSGMFEYRLAPAPTPTAAVRLTCGGCAWEGTDITVNHTLFGLCCPRCGAVLEGAAQMV